MLSMCPLPPGPGTSGETFLACTGIYKTIVCNKGYCASHKFLMKRAFAGISKWNFSTFGYVNNHFTSICFDLLCRYPTIKVVLNAIVFFLFSTPFLKNPDSIKDFHLNDVLFLQNIRSSRVSSSIYLDVGNLKNKVPETFEDWFIERNICDNEAQANLTKNFCMQIKIGVQYHIS